MTNHALISIHPKHVENIVAGIKTVELRRTNLHLHAGQELWIYSTVPDSRIGLVASVNAVHRLSPSIIWRRFGSKVAINHDEFSAYAGGRSQLTAIELGNIRRLRTPYRLAELRQLKGGFHPPQLAIYLSGSDHLLAALKRRYS